MKDAEYITTAKHLLAALYAAPQHGPVVAALLDKPEYLPAGFGAIYADMVRFGIAKGRLDYALFDSSWVGDNEYLAVTNPDGFDAAQFRHEKDPSMLCLWAERIANIGRNREMAKELAMISGAIKESAAPTEEIVSRIIERIRPYIETGRTSMMEIREAVELARRRMGEWKEGVVTDYMPTWASVDDALGGFPIGEMSVLAGMTSGFKTASLVDLLKRVALRLSANGKERAAVIFSAEMSAEKLVHRMASNLSGVPASRLRPHRGRSFATDEEWRRYNHALSRIEALSIFIDPSPSPSYEQMYSRCLQVQVQLPIEFVGFDYLEKMQADADSEELRVSKIAQSLKTLAKQLEVPVVTLSQYSREAEKSSGNLPKNYWLRYSGKVEQEANTIIHWHYPKYFIDRKHNPKNVEQWNEYDPFAIYGICGKNRDGEVKDVVMHVDEATGRFIDPLDEREQEELPF